MPPPRLRSTLFPYTTLFRSGLRPAGRGVLPVLLASVGQDVDEGERVTELLGAAAVRVPGAVDGVPGAQEHVQGEAAAGWRDRKSTRLNSSHVAISYAVFCLKKKRRDAAQTTTRRQPAPRTT